MARCISMTLACAAAGACAAFARPAAAADAPAAATSVPASAVAEPAPTPAGLRGTWQALHVAVNRAVASATTVRWEPDDARLLGALRVFDAAGSVDEDLPAGCRRLAWSAGAPAPLSALLAGGPRGPRDKNVDAPAPASYGLHVGDPTLQPYTAACLANADGRATPYEQGRWLALLSADRLLMGEGPGVVLVLERVTPETPMHAAIDCTQAVGDAQKTLCASRRLAGLDLAVAAAYRHALLAAHRRGQEAAAMLRQSQDAWRAKREGCGTDAPCLAASMRDRIDVLMAN